MATLTRNQKAILRTTLQHIQIDAQLLLQESTIKDEVIAAMNTRIENLTKEFNL